MPAIATQDSAGIVEATVRPLTYSLSHVAQAFAARAAENDRLARIPTESLAIAAEGGLFALTVPRQHGGGGAGLAQTVAIARRLGASDPSATLILAMTWLQHASQAREQRWPEALYREVARSAVERQGLINALRVEPELGTPFRGGLPKTMARCAGDGWRISGHKIYATGASVLQWLVVFARTDEDPPRVGQFLVPAGAQGIRIEETWDHLGMRATGSHGVVFADVAVPLSHAVDLRPPEEWRVLAPVQSAWNAAVIAAIYLGVAEAARAWLVRFLHDRVPSNLGRPLATLERMQRSLGEIEALVHSAGLMLAALADKADRSPAALDLNEPGIVKHVVVEQAIRAVEAAVALAGNPGLSRTNPLERHLRDVLCARVHTPQTDSVILSAGVAALKTRAALGSHDR
jgi:alkylation response protein AidB-like acyl-CoA dehydrogenase